MHTKANPPCAGFEQGAYCGDPMTEILQRLRRIEIRNTKFMRFSGFNPHMSIDSPIKGRVIAEKNVITATNSNITLGEISSLANEHRISGCIKIFIGSNYWGEFHCNTNSHIDQEEVNTSHRDPN